MGWGTGQGRCRVCRSWPWQELTKHLAPCARLGWGRVAGGPQGTEAGAGVTEVCVGPWWSGR